MEEEGRYSKAKQSKHVFFVSKTKGGEVEKRKEKK